MEQPITIDTIEQKIYLVRSQKVLLDSDLAQLYGVSTKVLIQAVKRNISRFPQEFMFRLSEQEISVVRSQIVTLKKGRGQHRKYLPYVFTEQGVAMLSSVLRSDRAIEVNIQIMRVFVKLRGLIAQHKDLAEKLEELEQRYDAQFRVVFDAIRAMLERPAPEQKKIGFIKEQRAVYGKTAA